MLRGATTAALVALGAVAGCSDPPPAPVATQVAASATEHAKSIASAKAVTSAAVSASASVTASPAGSASASPSASASAAVDTPPLASCGDAAVELPFTGPATLFERGGDVRVVFNDGGVARVVLPAPAPSREGRVAFEGKASKATSPACSRGAESFFCSDASGALHRQREGGEGDKVVAAARPGAPIAATSLGPTHALVAFLSDRKTTEGAVTLAFVALDDDPPMMLSEDGSGATFVALAPAEGHVVAAYVDARRSMTPVHARELTLDDKGHVALGKDVVAFVGEGADVRTPCTLVASDKGVTALVPIGDGPRFGMAAVKLGIPLVDDAPVAWSNYPNGCAPAPIAAEGGAPSKVARARPTTREPNAKKTLELGDLDSSGGFSPACSLAEAGSISDVALARDAHGTTWVAFTDGAGTWLVRHPSAQPASPPAATKH